MFKKDPQPKASANIKSSERRKLLSSICDTYGVPKDKLSKEEEFKLLPATVKQASFKSIQRFQGTIYYDENETPIYFKSRDSQVYPSLYTLWKCPYVVPTVITNPYVVEVLNGGADLMLPGCGTPFDERITKGTVVGVVGSDAPTVITAIGVARLNLKDISRTVGTSGVAVEILHHMHDELYGLNKYVDIEVPKEVQGYDFGETVETVEPEGTGETVEPEGTGEAGDAVEPVEPGDAIEPVKLVESDGAGAEDTGVSDVAVQMDELRVEDLDHFFTRALLQSIKLDTIPLPISASNFMANHLLKNLPVLDSKYKNIKKTSWKKTGKYLKAMSKLGYIQVKGKDDDLTIISTIPKSDKLVEDFVPHKVDKPKKKDDDKKGKEMVKVVQLYLPTGKYRSFFNAVDEDYTNLYDAQEIKSLVTKYIKEKELVASDPKKIKIDTVLGEIIPGNEIGRNEIVAKFLKYLSLKYVVIQPGQDIEDCKINNGPVPKIDIICETKIGRKTITRVKYFSKFGIKPHIIAEDLRNLCQGSSTLEETRDDTEVIVQGPHYKTILTYLTDKGISNSFITYEDKSKKKKKRTS